MQVKYYALMMILVSSIASASAVSAKKSSNVQRKISSIECTFAKWPYEDKVINKQNIPVLQKLDRSKVRSFYFNEITSSPVRKELAFGLYDYLVSTEPNENIRAFLKLTSYSSELETAAPKTLDQKQICDIAKHVSVELPTN